MEIREATNSDLPEIIKLLKVSLGEDLMPKSERYWRWKHVDNPFGRSPVLLCFDNGKLVGVRAFMRWEWVKGGKVFKAVRAVDTATHPAYQGKGIFKKLTLSLVNNCTQSGDDFVFNTPNAQSKPGYLKMGWQEAGRLPIEVWVNKPLSLLKNLLLKPSSKLHESNRIEVKNYLVNTQLAPLLESSRRTASGIITNVSGSYLTWRYLDVPVAEYIAIGEQKGDSLAELIVARIKNTRLGKELRITDMFFSDERPSESIVQKLQALRKSCGVDYCTVSGTTLPNSRKFFGSLSLKAAVGPIVTIRNLNKKDLSDLKAFKNWSPSLGDLELF